MPELVHMPLDRTMICIDCEELYMTSSPRCPVCKSGYWFPVELWLRPHLDRHPLKPGLRTPLARGEGT